MLVGVLTFYALFPSVWLGKFTQMKVQCGLIYNLILYVFKLSHNPMETNKNICCAKDEGAVDNITVNRFLKKYSSSCMKVNNQGMSGRPKTVDSEKLCFKHLKKNLQSSTQTVSNKLRILLSHGVHHLHDLCKSI